MVCKLLGVVLLVRCTGFCRVLLSCCLAVFSDRGLLFRAPASLSVHKVTLQRACKPGLFLSSGAADGGLFGRGFQKGGSPALAAVGFLRAGLQKFSDPCVRLGAAWEADIQTRPQECKNCVLSS